MEKRSPAKINLFLNVGPEREDLFHQVQTIMVKTALADTLTFNRSDELTVEGPDWLPMEENLVYRAALMLKEKTGYSGGCRIELEKEVPAGRGLGGGSSDCASALTGLNEFWQLGLELKELEKIGGSLGSDVNFFLTPGGALATGRGEEIRPLSLEADPGLTVLIVDPGMEISTGKIYEKYPGGKLTLPDKLDRIIEKYEDGSWTEILRNDLEETVFSMYPVIGDLKKRLRRWGLHPLLSGSGSCMFALTEDRGLAERAAGILEENFEYKSWITEILDGV